jgi:dUTP pyrophosphatase
MIIEYAKKSKWVKTPTRANPSDAGLDVYANLGAHNLDLPHPIIIESGQNALIPTGLRFGIPHGYMLQVCNRSSMGAKKSLVVGAHVIDSGYDGEVFIDLHNVGTKKQIIAGGDKIAQVVMVPVIHFRLTESFDGTLYKRSQITMSGREDGALGSSDTQKGHPLNDMNVGGF